MQITTDSAMQANIPGHGMIRAGQHDEKILQTANCMINYHLGFLISKEVWLSKKRMPSKLSSLLQGFLRG